jgi:sphingomyelin phosphodiesterase acid-like 3
MLQTLMRRLMPRRAAQTATLCLLLVVWIASRTSPVTAQAPAHPRTVSVLMLSDIHFDPFHDPEKFDALQRAPVGAWAKVLSAPEAATQPDSFAALQKTCRAKGVDTDWPLFASALNAARQQDGAALFVTVSGDLLAHNFECRFQTLSHNAGPDAYAAFAEKTAAFVALQLRLQIPHTPIYLALGNNDSGCGDYHETPDSGFLHTVANDVATDAPADDRGAILRIFPDAGDYSVLLPQPMERTRLIVLQDIFQSSRYQTCDGGDDDGPAKSQVAWLAQQLAQARAAGEHVWVMAHIPPGVDAYSSFHHGNDVCSGDSPALFLRTDAMARTLEGYAQTIRLVVLAHTHNDEMRLLPAADSGAIPAKLIPSISPVHGNNPSFLVAQVNPKSATMVDYSVYAAGNQTGIGTAWPLEYRYSTSYGMPDFSGASLKQLIAEFAADPKGGDAKSRDYQRWYAAGQLGKKDAELPKIWAGYVCSMTVSDAAAFRSCVCSAKASTP